jgi:hypothetical protein
LLFLFARAKSRFFVIEGVKIAKEVTEVLARILAEDIDK